MVLSAHTPLLEAVLAQFKAQDVRLSTLDPRDVQVNDTWIKSTLQEIAEQTGEIDGFLYLAGNSEEPALMPFLFAKHLSRHFHRSDHPSRKAFVIAISLDGCFGLNTAQDWQPETGAFAGLVKTLHQEWPWVFTRIIDFAPQLDTETVASQIVAEWTDADRRWVEIGITSEVRQTVEFIELPPR